MAARSALSPRAPTRQPSIFLSPTWALSGALRAGDDLYRLALLLAPSPAAAAHALLAATRRLAAADAGASEPALLAALRAALPPDRRFWPLRRRPAWARPAANHPQPQLLRALAALPQPQRLLLGLTLLRDQLSWVHCSGQPP